MPETPIMPASRPARNTKAVDGDRLSVASSIRFSLYWREDQRQNKSMRRVAITGIGAVSPNGIGRERFWEATRNGVSGVRRITRFDPTGYQVQVAGQVPDEFDEKLYVEIKDRPHVSRAVPLAAAAVAEALCDAGLDVHGIDRKSTRLNSSHDQISYAV